MTFTKIKTGDVTIGDSVHFMISGGHQRGAIKEVGVMEVMIDFEVDYIEKLSEPMKSYKSTIRLPYHMIFKITE